MMIKINQSVLEERNNDLYETVRSAWKVNLNKAKQYKYCLAVVDGIVKMFTISMDGRKTIGLIQEDMSFMGTKPQKKSKMFL